MPTGGYSYYVKNLTLGYCCFISCKMENEKLGLSSRSKSRVLNAGPVCSRILRSPVSVSLDASPRSRVVRQETGQNPLVRRRVNLNLMVTSWKKHLLIL